MEKTYKKPRVSVVLCTYNNESSIRQSVDSILNQTFEDFEFIIWDDGSSDKTANLVKSYCDNRIHYYYHENTGLGEALRMACNEACGKYIVRMDADDISYPNRIEEEVKYMDQHPDCILLSSAVDYMDEKGELIGRSFPYTWNQILQRVIKTNNPFVHPASIFRKDAYLESKGYPGTRCFQDRILFRDLAKKGKIHNLRKPLLKYRFLSESVSHSLGKYASILHEMASSLSESEEYKKEEVEHFNSVYLQAKSLCLSHGGRLGNEGWYRLYCSLAILFTNDIAECLVVTIHNLFGCIYYSIFEKVK